MDMKSRPARRLITAFAATGVLIGGIAAGVIGVTAATAAPVLAAATTTTPSTSATADTDKETKDGHGRAGETVVTGAKADTLRAAALKAVPGATVERIETDADGAAYEVHLTKADGSRATVKFDAKLAQIAVESGMGAGDRTASDGDGENAAS